MLRKNKNTTKNNNKRLSILLVLLLLILQHGLCVAQRATDSIYTQQQISTLIKEKSGIDFGNIIDLVPIKRGESGRLIKLKIVGDKKILIVGKELEIRRWLSKTHLYSSAFTIAKQNVQNNIPNTFVIKGAGWGHGVGLCQIGAATMGEKGYNYQEILKHYFKNISIEKIY